LEDSALAPSGGNESPTSSYENVRTFAKQGLPDEVMALVRGNPVQTHDFLPGVEDLAIDVMESSDQLIAIVHSHTFQKTVIKQQDQFGHLMDTRGDNVDYGQ
jgi:hypothetical protein